MTREVSLSQFAKNVSLIEKLMNKSISKHLSAEEFRFCYCILLRYASWFKQANESTHCKAYSVS